MSNLTNKRIGVRIKEADKIIIENNRVLKSIKDKKVFLNTILNPPAPNSKLKKALLKCKEIIETNGDKHIVTSEKSR